MKGQYFRVIMLVGPYKIIEAISKVEESSIGIYILSRDGFNAHYVGRSDSDLLSRIRSSSHEGIGYKYFWFEYAMNPIHAFQLESEYYHKLHPSDNSSHPAVPARTNWKCPVEGCEMG